MGVEKQEFFFFDKDTIIDHAIYTCLSCARTSGFSPKGEILLYSSVCELCSRRFTINSIPLILCSSLWFIVLTIITVNSVMTCLSVMILAPYQLGPSSSFSDLWLWLSFDYLLIFPGFNYLPYCLYRHMIILISNYLLFLSNYLWLLLLTFTYKNEYSSTARLQLIIKLNLCTLFSLSDLFCIPKLAVTQFYCEGTTHTLWPQPSQPCHAPVLSVPSVFICVLTVEPKENSLQACVDDFTHQLGFRCMTCNIHYTKSTAFIQTPPLLAFDISNGSRLSLDPSLVLWILCGDSLCLGICRGSPGGFSGLPVPQPQHTCTRWWAGSVSSTWKTRFCNPPHT